MTTVYENVWTFALPRLSNDGARNYYHERRAWVHRAVTLAGGCTEHGSAQGNWRAPGGKVYRETMYHYTVRCAEDVKDVLLNAARDLFPDQLAFYVGAAGTAYIADGHSAALARTISGFDPALTRRLAERDAANEPWPERRGPTPLTPRFKSEVEREEWKRERHATMYG